MDQLYEGYSYEGYSYMLGSGSAVRHQAMAGRGGRLQWVVLELEGPYGKAQGVSLSVDDAIKLASSLMRDACLIKYGSG